MAPLFGFKKGFLEKKSSSSSSCTTTAVSPPSSFRSTSIVLNKNDVTAGIATGAATSPPSSTECRAPQSGRDECPICYHVLPLANCDSVYMSCCGKVICQGCIVGRERAQVKESGFIIEGKTPEDKQFMLILKHWSGLCPFCRAEYPANEEEVVQRLNARISIRNDEDYTIALVGLGSCYLEGKHGLPLNYGKAEEIFQQAYDLGNPTAASDLVDLYERHYPDQKEKMMKYLLRGETLGNIACMQFLINLAIESKNHREISRLCMKVARLGGDTQQNLMSCYENQVLSKDDLAATLRAHQAVQDETKTARREYAKRFMKKQEDAKTMRNGNLYL